MMELEIVYEFERNSPHIEAVGEAVLEAWDIDLAALFAASVEVYYYHFPMVVFDKNGAPVHAHRMADSEPLEWETCTRLLRDLVTGCMLLQH